jgi:hypothetical protein
MIKLPGPDGPNRRTMAPLCHELFAALFSWKNEWRVGAWLKAINDGLGVGG